MRADNFKRHTRMQHCARQCRQCDIKWLSNFRQHVFRQYGQAGTRTGQNDHFFWKIWPYASCLRGGFRCSLHCSWMFDRMMLVTVVAHMFLTSCSELSFRRLTTCNRADMNIEKSYLKRIKRASVAHGLATSKPDVWAKSNIITADCRHAGIILATKQLQLLMKKRAREKYYIQQPFTLNNIWRRDIPFWPLCL